ncbi:hypothetical protein [Moheibacter lacus]|uniref:Uncharacterized protein n=1 Tax=Moheibacter lacus TaxID=2745851 RepID=A0A838ZMC3_9FLAO|nr:hypothetical protein [Moheibacter lacus]MBA5628736.1 hypothetical protein [Moheibacter lacus]
MSTDELKINIAQRIFNISDEKILSKINDLLQSENIIGYRTDNSPIFERQYLLEMESQQESIKKGEAVFFTSDEIRKKIMNENHLGK